MAKKSLPIVYLVELLVDSDSQQDSDVTLKLDWAIQFVFDAFKRTEHILEPRVDRDPEGALQGIGFFSENELMASITAYDLACELEECSHAAIQNAVAGGLSALQANLCRIF